MKEMEQLFSMKISSLAKYAIGITTSAAMLAACSSGGSSSLAPAGTAMGPGATVHGLATLAAHPYKDNGVRSPVTPLKKKKKGGIQYISDFYGSDILSFDYPKGDSSTGTISVSEPQGLCTAGNVGKSTWWAVSSGSDEVDEFKAGGSSPMSTLSVSAGEPAGCSVSYKGGDVAVSILSAGDVVVFKGGKGSGTTISDGLEETYFLGYDTKGNLYADGIGGAGVELVEMASGKSTFSQITLPNTIEFPGQVQYDGKYITVNDQEGYAIYGYTVSGTKATLKQTVSYTGASDCVQTWIAKKWFICPDAGDANGKIYAYPKGGAAIATLTGSFSLPIGGVALK